MLLLQLIPQIKALLIPDCSFVSISQMCKSTSHICIESGQIATVINSSPMCCNYWFADHPSLSVSFECTRGITASRYTFTGQHQAIREVVRIFHIGFIKCCELPSDTYRSFEDCRSAAVNARSQQGFANLMRA